MFVLSSLESLLTTGGNKVTGVASEYKDHVPASTSGLIILAFSFLEDTILTSGGITFTGVYVSRQVKRFLIHFRVVPSLLVVFLSSLERL